MADLKAGDVVELKSGGARMTIENIRSDGKVVCSWHLGHEPKTVVYAKEALKYPDDDTDLKVAVV